MNLNQELRFSVPISIKKEKVEDQFDKDINYYWAPVKFEYKYNIKEEDAELPTSIIGDTETFAAVSHRPRISTHQCNKCFHTFSCVLTLNLHKRKVHGRAFKCDHCSYKAPFDILLKHLEEYHAGHKNQCPHCGYLCPNQVLLGGHIRSKHLKVPHECCYCEYKTFNEDFLKLHYSSKHGYQCPICNYTAKNLTCVETHVSQLHENKILYKCNLCMYLTTSRANQEVHVLRKHNTPPPNPYSNKQNNGKDCLERKEMYNCNLSSYGSDNLCPIKSRIKMELNETKLEEDNVEHAEEVWYTCTHCPFKTSLVNSFCRHVQNHYSDDIL